MVLEWAWMPLWKCPPVRVADVPKFKMSWLPALMPVDVRDALSLRMMLLSTDVPIELSLA